MRGREGGGHLAADLRHLGGRRPTVLGEVLGEAAGGEVLMTRHRLPLVLNDIEDGDGVRVVQACGDPALALARSYRPPTPAARSGAQRLAATSRSAARRGPPDRAHAPDADALDQDVAPAMTRSSRVSPADHTVAPRRVCVHPPAVGARRAPGIRGGRRRAPAPAGAGALRWCRASPASGHLLILVTRPAPTVRPPSRMAKRRPSSMAMGWMSSTAISVLSPGMTISVPSGRCTTPVTSVVRK